MTTYLYYSQTKIAECQNLSPSETLQRLASTLKLSPEQLLHDDFWLSVDGVRVDLSRVEAKPNKIATCTEPDGSVWGVRFFNVYPPGFLISPTSSYVWQSDEETAADFTNAGAVRGHIGFHAAWCADLQNWVQEKIDHHECPAVALVRGFGDIVIGEEGWRSSRLRIVSVATKHPLLPALQARYPRIAFNAAQRRVTPEALSLFSPLELLTKYPNLAELKRRVHKLEVPVFN